MNPNLWASPTFVRHLRAATAAWLGIVLLGAPNRAVAESPKADCELAVSEFLKQRNEGDHSARLLSELAQALECSGRVEEALGATYMDFTPDTAAKTGLLVVRIQLLRELGLNDVARDAEEELGIARTPSDAGSTPERKIHWAWDKRPLFSGSIGWFDQLDQPHPSSISARYDTILDQDLGISSTPVGSPIASPADSILLEGANFQVMAGMAYGVWSEAGGFSFGPSGSVSFPVDTLHWRSASAGLDLNAMWGVSPSFTLLMAFSGSRAWFRPASGPMPIQDDLTFSPTLNWGAGPWSASLPQLIHAYRTNSASPTWTGIHSAGLGWTALPRLKVSASASLGWNRDPTSKLDDSMVVKILRGEGFQTERQLSESRIYTPSGLLAGTAVDTFRGVFSDTHSVLLPVLRNSDWIQVGIGTGLSLGPWHGATFGLTGQWSATSYPHLQEGQAATVAYGDWDTLGNARYVLVFRDSTTKAEYVVGYATGTSRLVPTRWQLHRRDQCWSAQSTLLWKATSWLGLRAAWAWTRNISNLEDYVDGASYVRNVISISSSVSW